MSHVGYAQFYRLLGLREGATKEAIKAAYHRAAKRNHPDLFPESDRPRQQLRMMRINEAYLTVIAAGGHWSRDAGREDGCSGDAGSNDSLASGARASGAPPGDDRAFEAGAGRDERADDGRDEGAAATAAGFAGHGHAVPGGADSGGGGPDTSAGNATGRRVAGEPAGGGFSEPGTDVANPRDPAYTYYKLGFVYYRKGYTELFRKDAPGSGPRQPAADLKQLRTQLLDVHTMDKYLLVLTIRALHYFEQSYRYFLRVVEEYPGSIWVHDSRWKLRRLDTFNNIYHRICENLSRSIRVSRPIVRGAEPSK